MRHTKLFIAIIIILLIIKCGTTFKTYSIEIQHFSGAIGLTIYYTIDNEFISIDTDCDFQDCKKKNVYKRPLTSEQSDVLFKSLKSLQLDTLKTIYKPDLFVLDGLVSKIKLRGTGIPNKEISIDNVDVPTIDSLSFHGWCGPNPVHRGRVS